MSDAGRTVPLVTEIATRPLRRSEYDLLVQAGVFGDERVQLLEGELVSMPPQGVPHSSVVEALTERLVPALVGRARVRVQLPYGAGPLSEPEPDLAVLPADEPRDRHPERALLVVEVADSSLRLDLVRKARIYAGAGVPEYWVVDVGHEVVHVHRTPVGDGYADVQQVGRHDELEAVGVRLTLDELLSA